MFTQCRFLRVVALAARELREAVEVASDGQAMVGGTTLATHLPLLAKRVVHALSLSVAR